MRVIGIDHVALNVRDIDSSLAFYKLLGCSVERRANDIRLVQLRAGDALIDLIERGRDSSDLPWHGGNLDHFCLRVADFDNCVEAIRHDLAAHAVEIGALAERYGSAGMATTLYIKDRDGNGVELRG